MRIDEIVIGERVRKDMGDIDSLADSIQRHGLLHPVVVKADRTLIAGQRRIEAVKRLGWREVEVTVIEVDDLLSAERDENGERKDFTPTEAVAIGRLIEGEHRAKIAAQEAARKRLGPKTALKERGQEPAGDTRIAVGRAVGMSPSSYDRAKAVVAAAEADPEKFGDLPEQMDEAGNVSGTHREMQRRATNPAAKKPRHKVHRRAPHPKPNREIERAIFSLEGICGCLDAIKTEQLDAAKTGEWALSLKAFATRLNRFARRINE